MCYGSGARLPLGTVIAFIDAPRVELGVEPACRVLRQEGCGIAPSTYYAARSRPPSARAVRDAWLEGEITRVFKASGERSGARKVWWQLHREHVAAGRAPRRRAVSRPRLRLGRAGR